MIRKPICVSSKRRTTQPVAYILNLNKPLFQSIFLHQDKTPSEDLNARYIDNPF